MRNARVRVALSVAAGAVIFRIEAVLALAGFLAAIDAACMRGAAGFFAAALEAAVAFLAPVPVRVGFVTVVPEDALDEALFLRSACRVAGRGKGERVVVLGPVAARLVVF